MGNLSNTETRVYAVNLDIINDERVIKNLPDNEFKDIAEEQGLVYTLKGFEMSFNNDEVSDQWVIRFLEVVIA